jgi:hypothetical protein
MGCRWQAQASSPLLANPNSAGMRDGPAHLKGVLLFRLVLFRLFAVFRPGFHGFSRFPVVILDSFFCSIF